MGGHAVHPLRPPGAGMQGGGHAGTGCWWLVVVVAGLFLPQTTAFSLATRMPTLKTGPNGTQFGFSVALWSDVNGDKWLVVGAPRGKNSTVGRGELPLGEMYICDLSDQHSNDSTSCNLQTNLPMVNDEDKSKVALDIGTTMRKEGMGFGHSLGISKADRATLVACAPRYPRRGNSSMQSRGACFLLDSPGAQPLPHVFFGGAITGSRTYHDAMFGFSVVVDDSNQKLTVGGPGAWLGAGTVIVNKPKDKPKSKDYSTTLNRNPHHFLYETYSGWDVVLGKFDRNKPTTTFVATSTFRDSMNTSDLQNGSVSIYSMGVGTSLLERVLQDKESWNNFGYCLVTADVDGDDVDDLVVGAPLAYGPRQQPNNGKIFVYLAPLTYERNTRARGRRKQELLGDEENFAHFGSALTSLADLNMDGYEDIAVGAPGWDTDKGGAVYIFHGSPRGLRSRYTQVIHGTEFGGQLRGFGVSLSGGRDMDDNAYPDLAVGASQANAVIFLRSAPVVTLKGDVHFGDGAGAMVVAEGANCTVEAPGNREFRAVCFPLHFNFTYESERDIGGLDMEFEVNLEGQNDTSQFGLRLNNGYRYSTTRNVYWKRAMPWSISVFMKRAIDNINESLTATVSVKLASTSRRSDGETAVPPILNQFRPSHFSSSMTLVCRNSSTCFSQPDLVLNAEPRGVVVLGQDDVEVKVTLAVRDDPGYDVEVKVNYPAVVQFERARDEGGPVPVCRRGAVVGEIAEDHSCFFSFIEADQTVEFWLVFSFNAAELLAYTDKNDLRLGLSVSADGTDVNKTNNDAQVTVNVTTQAKLKIIKDSEPETLEVMVNNTASREKLQAAETNPGATFPVDNLGPILKHKFTLRNHGPSPVRQAKLEFYLPLYRDNQLTTYYMSQPVTSGPVTCDPMETNPYGLQPPTTDNGTDSSHTTPSDSGFHNLQKREEHKYSSPSQLSRNTPGEAEQEEVFFLPLEATQLKALDIKNMVFCLSPKCRVTCSVDLLQPNSEVAVSFSGYLIADTISRLWKSGVEVVTQMKVQVTQTGTDVDNSESLVKTPLSLDRPQEKGLVFALTWWQLLLAILLAMVLIALMIAVFKKMGFFERKRPPILTKHQSAAGDTDTIIVQENTED